MSLNKRNLCILVELTLQMLREMISISMLLAEKEIKIWSNLSNSKSVRELWRDMILKEIGGCN